MAILKVKARTIYDSRGNPTVETDIITDDGLFRSSAPSGASTGSHEAKELRDGDESKWLGKGVTKAVHAIDKVLGPAIIGLDPVEQASIDEILCRLDGTEDKSSLGANSIVSISMAVARAGAARKGIPLYQHIGDLAGNTNFVLPTPAFNVINGGVHAGNELAQQEFLILPTGAESFSEGMRWATEVYHKLRIIIKDCFGVNAVNVGDEGGFAPPVHSGNEALDLIEKAIQAAGLKGKVKVAFDSAASEFFADGEYTLDFKAKTPKQIVSGIELASMYKEMIKGRPIAFVEDPFAEDDWDPAIKFTAENDIEVIGDDMLCTNPKRIKRAIGQKAVNSLLLKVNQIGTVTEAIEATRLAKGAKWGVLTSHRSGETADDFIADLSVGLATGHMKSGSPARGERLAKYNRLLRIEEDMKAASIKPKYAGEDFRYISWG